jgi:signal transduction histidine kinase/transcriptional regulator with GAF, ATPase, and Fis domain
MNKRDDTFKHGRSELSSQDEGHVTLRVGHENLLYAVVAACECMVAHTGLMDGLQAAMEQLGSLSGHDRAYVWELTDEQTVCVLVANWDAPSIQRIADMAGTNRFAVADFKEVWTPLLADQAYQSVTPVKTGANARLNETVANRSDLMVPIFVGTQCWGCIGFDNCREERRYTEAEIQALRGAASAISAAVQRCALEDKRTAEERQRTTEALALNGLLEGVVQASRVLVDEEDFKIGLPRWLASLARAVSADAAMLASVVEGKMDRAAVYEVYWSAKQNQTESGMPVPATQDFVAWNDRLHRGESIWAHRDELIDPESVGFWERTDCWSSLLVPVRARDKTVGVLSLDWRERHEPNIDIIAALQTATDGLAAALQREQALRTMLAERERRIEVEQARADEAARHAARIERHSHLLAAVAASAEDLLAAREPRDCMDTILARLSEKSRAQRAALVRFDWTPDDAQLRGWQEVVHEWAAPDEQRQMDTPMRRFPMRRDEPVYDRLEDEFRNTGRIIVNIAQQEERYRTEQESLGVSWSMGVPFIVDGEIWGALGFDYATPFEHHDEAELSALQTVASAIADALIRQRLEARALAAECARADEAERHAARIERHSRLLAAVAESAEELLACTDPVDCMDAVLARVGEVTHAERVCLARLDWTPQDPALHGWQEIAHEWARPGVARQMDGPLLRFAMQRSDTTWSRSLKQFTVDRRILATMDSMDEPFRSEQLALGIVWSLCYPVLLEGQVWGLMGMDYATAFTDYDEADLSALQTVATTIANAMLRRTLEQRALATERARVADAQALLAERERRLAAEELRNSELARANAALGASIKALSESANADGFMRQSLHEIDMHSGAASAYLFQTNGNDKKLRIIGSVRDSKFSSIGWSDDPEMFVRGFELLSPLREMLIPQGRLVWRRVDLSQVPNDEMSDSTKWHLQQRHGANALHALLVGERLVGLIGLVFESDAPLTASQEEVIHALCQPLALALELGRLAKLAQRSNEQSAILSERNRLAREIHDGIAQNFLAIQMQIDSLDLSLQQLKPMSRAMEMAKVGLREARRAVAALRPHELLNHDLCIGLKRLLAQMTAGSTIEPIFESPAGWQRLPLDVEDHLFRIVQEALNNAIKHAKAQRIRVELSQAAGEVTVLIADDGIGFDVALLRQISERDDYSGYGLVGMQQRARLINARIDYQSNPTKGTQVLLSWSAPPDSEQYNVAQHV